MCSDLPVHLITIAITKRVSTVECLIKMTEEAAPVPLTYFANAQTEFASTIPLVANENAYLGDVAFRYAAGR